MVCRFVGSGSALSFKLAQMALFAGSMAAIGCGTMGPSQQEATEISASATEALSITNPAAPLAVALPQGADPLAPGLTVPADAPQRVCGRRRNPGP